MRAARLAIAGLFCAAALSACTGSDGTQRVEARTGQIVLDSEMDGFNFSVELPDMWTVHEHFVWGSESPASGWIEEPEAGDVERVFITWGASDEWDSGVLAQARQEGDVIIEDTVVEGARLRIVYPPPRIGSSEPVRAGPVEADPPGPRSVAAVFDSLPGAPASAPAIPLTLRTTVSWEQPSVPSRQQIETIIGIFKSVRYAAPNDPPEPPVKAVSPGPDWISLQPADFEGYAQGRSPRFTVTVPPGTTGFVFPTYDAIGVALQLGELRVSGGRGQADAIFGPPDPQPGVTIWQTQVADVRGYFWQRAQDDGSFDIGVYYPQIPETPAEGIRDPSSTALTLVAEAIPEDAQAEVLAVLESVRYGE